MIYGLLRWFTGIALHWFYSSIRIEGGGKIRESGPVIIAASHHNALVDALIAGWITPRRLTLTAKATLTRNPVIAWLFRAVGVVPLRRASDEMKHNAQTGPRIDRNAEAFENILDVLKSGGAILIFPEGKSHSDPGLAPLKTGVARIALAARDRGIHNLQIIPLGVNFEDKGNPGTAVLAEVGEPFEMDSSGSITVEGLTRTLTERLASVSLKQPEPSVNRNAIRHGDLHPIGSPLAAWGELTHRYIINYARDLALARSKSPDDPAMFTIVIALTLILASYVAQFAIVAALIGPFVALVYVATLPIGAYWAAYRNHALHPEYA